MNKYLFSDTTKLKIFLSWFQLILAISVYASELGGQVYSSSAPTQRHGQIDLSKQAQVFKTDLVARARVLACKNFNRCRGLMLV